MVVNYVSHVRALEDTARNILVVLSFAFVMEKSVPLTVIVQVVKGICLYLHLHVRIFKQYSFQFYGNW